MGTRSTVLGMRRMQHQGMGRRVCTRQALGTLWALRRICLVRARIRLRTSRMHVGLGDK